MQPFRKITSIPVPLDRSNVDTDQIIPKQFLKRIERTGYGEFLFFDWRRNADGAPDPNFVLNHERFRGAQILLAGKNFGCGSSREHAAWALNDFGFRCVIAPSFADIFLSNAGKNGILAITLPEPDVALLMERARSHSSYALTVCLEESTVRDTHGYDARFAIHPFRRECLLNGLDDIALTLRHAAAIDRYEQRHDSERWMSPRP
jgi:3-isopropylmalate/(R)-2-methylmalate dehydratase small subunit